MSNSNETVVSYAKEGALAYAGIPVGARATASFLLTGQPANTETITINAKVYTFQTVLTNVNGNVKIGATKEISLANLIAAIGLGAGAGTVYAAAMTAHTTVDAAVDSVTAARMNLTAKTQGTGGNAYGTTDTIALGSFTNGVTFSGGVNPAVAMKQRRFNSEGLKHRNDTVKTEEIRADRSVGDLILVGIGATGNTEHELYCQDFDDWLLSGLMGGAMITGNQVISCDSDGTSITTGGVFNSFVQGAKYLKISGSGDPLTNGIKRVVSVSDTVITFATGSLGGGIGENLTVAYNYMRNGTTLDSYIIEKYIVGAADYLEYLGMCIDSFSLKFEARKKAMATFNFLGYGGLSRLDTIASALTAPTNNPVLVASSNTGVVQMNNAALVAPTRGITFNLNNNLRERLALGQAGTLRPGSGSSDITGVMEGYFLDKALYDAFLANAAKSIFTSLVDSNGKVLSVYLPRVKFVDANPNAGGLNQDIMLPINFQAMKSPDDATGYQMQIDALV